MGYPSYHSRISNLINNHAMDHQIWDISCVENASRMARCAFVLFQQKYQALYWMSKEDTATVVHSKIVALGTSAPSNFCMAKWCRGLIYMNVLLEPPFCSGHSSCEDVIAKTVDFGTISLLQPFSR
jgi:hypothetical protein